MIADQDGAQGAGFWKTYVAELFDRFTNPIGYTFDDLSRIAAPTLILVGDRDDVCSVEEGVLSYRKLQQGEFAVAPGVGHFIGPLKVQLMIDFLLRHSASGADQAA